MPPPIWQVEPLGTWNRPITKQRTASGRFRATWAQTLDKLLDEIDHLEPTGTIAVRVDVEAGHIRRDGMLHARAQVNFPGVVVSFTSRGRGPLTFATDAYEDAGYGMPGWQANLRAIALSLEALRAVDRHGVSSGREQYVGWRAIEGGSGSGVPFSSARSAEEWLRERMGRPSFVANAQLLTTARRLWHPDAGGDRADWDLLQQAERLMRDGGLVA